MNLENIAYKQERVGDFIQIYSGKHFYILDPRAEDMDVESIAHSLSNLARFTGHGERFYSVAEHAIYCAKIARKLGFNALWQLYCLHHDDSECVMNDLARPVKQNIPQYKEIEDKIMKIMWDVAGVPEPNDEHYSLVKITDNTMLLHELEQLMKRNTIDYADLEHAKVFISLSDGYNAGEAKHDFLDMHYALIEEAKEQGLI
jgi:uncharacterized protein